MYTWNKENKHLTSDLDGSILSNNPISGELWANKTDAEKWAKEQKAIVEAEELALHTPLVPIYAGHIVLTSTAVKENTGAILQAPNPEASFSEMTVTKGSVLVLVASILSDASDSSTVITSLPKDMFRIPVHNQDSGE